ncbi:hypothetical protein F5Y07DRAFT_375454 [Xylaria sp. FL0933]|nr:hypothetical protein F5Y07DRAFT_375454 [Xylaria sp. FL0933]
MSHNPLDYEQPSEGGEGGEGETGQVPPVGSGGPSVVVDLTKMTLEERIAAFRRGVVQVPGTDAGAGLGMFRVLEPDAVKVPHARGHPLGMINKHEPRSSDNTYAQTDSSVEAGHQFVDMSHATSQPKPGDKTFYTARIVPNSVLERQSRMDADLQGPNPVGRLIDASNTGKVDPRLRAPRRDRGGHRRGGHNQGSGPSGRDRGRRGERDRRRPNATDPAANTIDPAEAEAKERVELEASQQQLSKEKSRCYDDQNELREKGRELNAEWRIQPQSQPTNHRIPQSLEQLQLSNGKILANNTQNQHEGKETEQLRHSYVRAKGQLEAIKTNLSDVKSRLQVTNEENEKVKREFATTTERLSRQEGQISSLHDQIANILSALERQLDEIEAERNSHSKTEELGLQLQQTQQHLKTVQAERDQLKDALTEKERNLKSYQDRLNQLEAKGTPKRPRETPSSSSSDSSDQDTPPAEKRVRIDELIVSPRIQWYKKIEDLKLLFYKFRLVCTQDANMTLGDALAHFLRAASDGYLEDIIAEFLREAPEGIWYCFQQITEHRFGNADAVIEDDKCYIHNDKCFQICNASNIEGYGSIYCRYP